MAITYGLPYMGSKNSIAKNLIKQLPRAENFYDLFCGGGSMAHRAAMKNTDPTAQAFWKQIAPDGKEPPVERVIASISLMVQENKLCS